MLDNDQAKADLDNIGEEEARAMLHSFCDNGFEGDLDETALVLGRDRAHLNAALDGSEDIDEDLLAKLRGIAEQRGINLSA